MKETILPPTIFVLQLGGSQRITAKMYLSQWQIEILSKDFRITDDGKYMLTSIRVNKNGAFLIGERGTLNFEPEVWADFWDEKIGGDHEFSGRHAVKKWALYQEWLHQQNADIALENVSKGVDSFESIAAINPELISQPKVKDAMATHLINGTWPKIRKPHDSITRREVELYNWATGYYVNSRSCPDQDPISWEGACDLACAKQPHLVPSSWKKDPGGNLKRLASRKLDHDYRYTQLSARQHFNEKSRDKK